MVGIDPPLFSIASSSQVMEERSGNRITTETEHTRIQRVAEPSFYRKAFFYYLLAIPVAVLALLLYVRARRR
jgi:hypothetical protein